jgi:glyoxylase-like metal-dependent hydrolase (beta-lactamase superfamily II)
MPRNEYLYSLALQHAPGDHGVEASKAFFLRHGLAADATAELLTKGQDYLRCTTGVPPHYHRLEHGQTFRVGARDFQVLTGGGHSMEQAMLYCAEQKLFLAADQVIAQISPNISVNAIEPEADSLGAYINSLRFLTETLPADVLVLAGHGLPFYGLHLRAAALIEHHAGRCALIRTACQGIEKSTADLIPVVFQQALDPHQTGFAFAEVLAHVNYMLGLGELRAVEAADGSVRYVSK